jgi:hypothetical protein
MKKIKLVGIGNQDKYNFYIFEKKQEVVEALSKILSEIFQRDIDLYSSEHQNKKGKWIAGKKINFERKKDEHINLDVEEPRIDIFFGDKKFFVSIICSQKLREKFNEELGKITFMDKPKS